MTLIAGAALPSTLLMKCLAQLQVPSLDVSIVTLIVIRSLKNYQQTI